MDYIVRLLSQIGGKVVDNNPVLTTPRPVATPATVTQPSNDSLRLLGEKRNCTYEGPLMNMASVTPFWQTTDRILSDSVKAHRTCFADDNYGRLPWSRERHDIAGTLYDQQMPFLVNDPQRNAINTKMATYSTVCFA